MARWLVTVMRYDLGYVFGETSRHMPALRQTMINRISGATACTAAVLLLVACGRGGPFSSGTPAGEGRRPSILLVTLDTTRADVIGPDAKGVATPAFDALVARGRRFTQAYATVPETLPSHTSMMTGLYPAGHGVHENGRRVSDQTPLLAERLRAAGYGTAAFVSTFTLARRFGLARGFDVYDDALPAGAVERSSGDTTDAALTLLDRHAEMPLFLWVHYNDPHAPYEPPEPYRSRYEGHPYLGEVATMDAQLGRLVAAFARDVPEPRAVAIVADHGEGLGDHGEPQHGYLLYQSTMHVPLVLVGPGVATGFTETPVSTRRIFFTILDWAGLGAAHSLLAGDSDPVLAEAMKPFLEFGWQPQSMIVDGTRKAILAGKVQEIYDVAADPGETHNLQATVTLPPAIRTALWDYPVPSLTAAAQNAPPLSAEDRQKLSSLGYVSGGVTAPVRRDAARPADMTKLFEPIGEADGLFVAGRFATAAPLLAKILSDDPHNLGVALQLAASYSALGQNAQAEATFRRAAAMAPDSPDVRLYLALHYARGPDWAQAAPLLDQVLASAPDRLPALEALATIRERQGRAPDAIGLWQRAFALRSPSAPELAHLGDLEMGIGATGAAITAFERARGLDPQGFRRDLDLGVLYLAARRFVDAGEALDRVPASDPRYPMALFKRAQVSALLNDPDVAARIAAARAHADPETRPLIAREKLFDSVGR
ncbi:MAG TPA: sulfatase-like hydrolase/transferase [Vicinamibacterales bacterium]